ncbi:transcriptional regulator [Photobacterium frigidiphilum]|uniref:Transcriptional regulator n=1 Tax=Photobacterium frigidiphilum TaxID=264736 RepID=A0A2T3JJI9_9GAMM|nr:winged helix-turn-helix domain-containing protein [Photobacterium frigidiphilum]PSU49174.1 transcriptional regulator [Photobacterium frigidiphilum]
MTSTVRYTLHHEPVIIFSPAKNQITINGEDVHLEPLQARLLTFFIEQQGNVVNAQQIADRVWDRSHVSDNLVRQVISLLRSQLQDKTRPYSIIKTIPKQGYLFNIEVTKDCAPLTNINHTILETENPAEDNQLAIQTESRLQSEPVLQKEQTVQATQQTTARPHHTRIKKSVLFIVLLAISGLGLGSSYLWQQSAHSSAKQQQGVLPVFLHEINLDTEQDYEMSQSVYNYLFYGLNSSKSISGYHFDQLTPEAKQKLTETGIEIKSWIKKSHDEYSLTVLLQNNQQPALNTKIEKTFNEENFFNAIGDVIIELKTVISPTDQGYEITNHRVTSVTDYNDWNVISEGISLFYQGKGKKALDKVTEKLNIIQAEGRGNYLVSSLLSYSESLHYLKSNNDIQKKQALELAKQAFEMNPRCDIANLTLGLALLLNDRSDQAFPYLFYAAESTPSPISYYLLSVVDKQADNPRGAAYHYQCYTEMKKEVNGQLFDLMDSLQKTNLLQTVKETN